MRLDVRDRSGRLGGTIGRGFSGTTHQRPGWVGTTPREEQPRQLFPPASPCVGRGRCESEERIVKQRLQDVLRAYELTAELVSNDVSEEGGGGGGAAARDQASVETRAGGVER